MVSQNGKETKLNIGMRCNANSFDPRRRSNCHRLKSRIFSLIHRAVREWRACEFRTVMLRIRINVFPSHALHGMYTTEWMRLQRRWAANMYVSMVAIHAQANGAHTRTPKVLRIHERNSVRLCQVEWMRLCGAQTAMINCGKESIAPQYVVVVVCIWVQCSKAV